MMLQQGCEVGNFIIQGFLGNVVIFWVIIKEEKICYDFLFKVWDGLGKGFIVGDQVIEIFGQSGFEKFDLEWIWIFVDYGNKGCFDFDEFVVVMYLIYWKFNGYLLFNIFFVELVFFLIWNFSQLIGIFKNMFYQEFDQRKNFGVVFLF